MRARIDPSLCQGHGMCRLVCPEVFDLNVDDGHAFLLHEEIPPTLEDSVKTAQMSCPEQAISID